MFNNVKLQFKLELLHSNSVDFRIKVLSLCRLYPYRKPQWAEVGQTYIHIRRNCTLWFWLVRTSQTLNCSSKTKQRERLMRCIIYSPHWLRTVLLFVVKSAFYIFTLAWGLSALLVSTGRAMRRPLHCGTSDRTGSTFLCIYTNHLLNMPIW